MKKFAVVLLFLACIQANAAIKAYVTPIETNYPYNEYVFVDFYDTSSMSLVSNKPIFLPKDNSINSTNDAIAYIKAAIYTEAGVKGYSITDADIIANWPLTGIPGMISFTNPSRSLNTAFQISTTQNVQVSYSVSIACTLSLVTGQSGTVVLEYADDSGFTTNVVTVQSSINANTGTLAIGLNLTQTVSASLTGVIPVGKYVRLRTISNTGSPTFTFSTSQEVLN